MQSTISNYERLNQATLAEMRRLGLTTDQPPVIDQPKNPFDLDRPDMSELNKINEQVQQHGGDVLADRDNHAENIQHNVDRGVTTFGNYKNADMIKDLMGRKDGYDIQQLNKDAASENASVGKEAWNNLFGKDKK